MRNLESFFTPKSVAVVGASRDLNKLGSQILKNLIRSGFQGKIYPINPKASKIENLKSFPSVLAVPKAIDLAVIVVPAKIVPFVLEEIGQKGIKSVIVITAGFGEIGKQGEKAQEDLKKILEKYKLRIVGPNCLGTIDTRTPLNTSFASNFPLKSNLAVVSQSGAMCAAILDWALKNNVGFSKFISLGNKIDVDEVDLFPIFLEDKNTKVVLGYFEGINRGLEFIKEAQKLTFKKPLIAIKAGASKAGAKAASSHTGALATDNEALDAAFRKAGIIRVSSIEELFDFSEAFSSLSFPKDEYTAVLANAGGPAVLTTDALSFSFLKLAQFSKKTKDLLRKNLPEEASVLNPVDIVGDAPAERYKKALEIILKDKSVSSLIVLLTPQTSTEIEKTALAISKAGKIFKKPIVCSFIGGEEVEKGVKILEQNGIPNFEFPERAVKALSELVFYKNFKRSFQKIKNPKTLRDKKIEKVISKARKENRKILNDLETKKIIETLKIKTAGSKLVQTENEAVRIAKKFGFPVVLKILSSEILHKTEFGLVRIGLKNQENVREAFREILKNSKKHKLKFKGIVVYKSAKEGTEVIIGAKKDPVFGPVLMFGLGGIYVELLKDIVFGIAPISKKEADQMIKDIKGYRLLVGFRGQKPVNLKKVKDAILKISTLMLAFPEIKELDINPLKADSENVVALDTKIVLE